MQVAALPERHGSGLKNVVCSCKPVIFYDTIQSKITCWYPFVLVLVTHSILEERMGVFVTIGNHVEVAFLLILGPIYSLKKDLKDLTLVKCRCALQVLH